MSLVTGGGKQVVCVAGGLLRHAAGEKLLGILKAGDRAWAADRDDVVAVLGSYDRYGACSHPFPKMRCRSERPCAGRENSATRRCPPWSDTPSGRRRMPRLVLSPLRSHIEKQGEQALVHTGRVTRAMRCCAKTLLRGAWGLSSNAKAARCGPMPRGMTRNLRAWRDQSGAGQRLWHGGELAISRGPRPGGSTLAHHLGVANCPVTPLG